MCIWLSPNKCSPSYCTAYIVNCLGQVTECSYCAAWPCTYSHSPATIYMICVPCLTVPHATVSLNEHWVNEIINNTLALASRQYWQLTRFLTEPHEVIFSVIIYGDLNMWSGYDTDLNSLHDDKDEHYPSWTVSLYVSANYLVKLSWFWCVPTAQLGCRACH